MPEEAGQRAVQCGLRQSNQADTEFHGVGTELHGKYNSSIRRFWPDASQRLPRRSLLRETPRQLRGTPCPLDCFAAAIANTRIMAAVEHPGRCLGARGGYCPVAANGCAAS